MARHLDEIRKRRPLDDEARARVDATKRAMSLQVALVELREGRGMSRAGLAEEPGTSRADVSRIESEVDARVSTLERYVEALGGRLEIHAVFDDEAVKLSELVAVDRLASARPQPLLDLREQEPPGPSDAMARQVSTAGEVVDGRGRDPHPRGHLGGVSASLRVRGCVWRARCMRVARTDASRHGR